MSKGLLNSMLLKNLFEGVDGAELLPSLIESGVINKEQVEEYYKANIKVQKEQKPTYSEIKDGVLVKFDERDLNNRGGYVTPKGVVEIGDEAFFWCEKLRRIHLSRDVKTIGVGAFNKCVNLQIVTMTNSVTKIKKHAFQECLNLYDLRLSDNIKELPENVFINCRSLQNLILPSTLESVGKHAFGNCCNLYMISNIPERLSFVHPDAFAGTPIGDDFMRIYHKQVEAQNQEKGNTK